MGRKIWGCTCHGPHYVEVVTLDFPEEDAGGWVFIQELTETLGWRNRIRAAWWVLWGRKHVWTEIELTPEIAHEMALELIRAAEHIAPTNTAGVDFSERLVVNG